jgi:mono/diheme cytochrome c family protein
LRSKLLFALGAVAFVLWTSAPAAAIPIFAQRYHFHCGQCHSVLPELNAFGNYFRSHGYRLPLPEHGTTIFALRYQLEYDKQPAPDQPR